MKDFPCKTRTNLHEIVKFLSLHNFFMKLLVIEWKLMEIPCIYFALAGEMNSKPNRIPAQRQTLRLDDQINYKGIQMN